MMTEEAGRYPRVTVVTVVYNLIEGGREEYFRQCLESVREQMYRDVEHIVIDGASTDGTIDILEGYRKKGWIRYYSEPDKGVYDAMNKGAEKASGKYITFLNSDDFFHNRLAISLSIEMLEREHSDFSCASTRVIYNEKPIAIILPKPEIFFCEMPFCSQSVFIRKDIFLKEKGFDTRYKVYADYDLVIRLLLKKSKISIINEDIVSFRYGGLSEISGIEKDKEKIFLEKKYFENLVKVIRHQKPKNVYGTPYSFNEYKVCLSELSHLRNKVCDCLAERISRIDKQLCDDNMAILKFKSYFLKFKIKYKFVFFSFSIVRVAGELPPLVQRKIYEFGIGKFHIKLFEIRQSPPRTVYRVLYIPILTKKN